jgi:hypothetical protein
MGSLVGYVLVEKKKCQKSLKITQNSLKNHSKITQNRPKSPEFQLWLPLPPGSDTGAQRHWLGRAPRTRAGKRGHWRPFDGVLRRKTAESGNMEITYKNMRITYKTGVFTSKMVGLLVIFNSKMVFFDVKRRSSWQTGPLAPV